jgi:hypothetical protein
MEIPSAGSKFVVGSISG